jgi:hypothetical protein
MPRPKSDDFISKRASLAVNVREQGGGTGSVPAARRLLEEEDGHDAHVVGVGNHPDRDVVAGLTIGAGADAGEEDDEVVGATDSDGFVAVALGHLRWTKAVKAGRARLVNSEQIADIEVSSVLPRALEIRRPLDRRLLLEAEINCRHLCIIRCG